LDSCQRKDSGRRDFRVVVSDSVHQVTVGIVDACYLKRESFSIGTPQHNHR
jgi:hypothetical protein